MSELSVEQLEELHKTCFQNRQDLAGAEQCGCFCCLAVFDFRQIVKWCDLNKTALCPDCGIDSVLATNDIAVLQQMNTHYFMQS